jgi:hypothetical protein
LALSIYKAAIKIRKVLAGRQEEIKGSITKEKKLTPG